jgi:hypothetical protein
MKYIERRLKESIIERKIARKEIGNSYLSFSGQIEINDSFYNPYSKNGL